MEKELTGTDGDRLVTIICSNHHQELVTGLWQLFTNQHAVDFELELGEQSIRMHQMMLEVFQLSADKLGSCENHVLDSKESDGTNMQLPEEGCLYQLIQFLYTGRVDVRHGQLVSLAHAAEKLNFRMLSHAIQQARSTTKFSNTKDSIGGDTAQSTKEQLVNDVSEVNIFDDNILFQIDSEWGLSDDNSSSDNDSDWMASSQRRTCPTRSSKKTTQATRQKSTPAKAISGQLRRAKTNVACIKRRASLPARTYQCPRCDFTSTGSWKYRHHLNTVHGVTTRGEPFQQLRCPDCPYTAIDRNQLKYHSVRHSANKPYKCQHCPYASGLKGCIVRHTAIVHPDTLPAEAVEPLRLLVCPHCDRFRTYKKRTYQHHLYSVHRLRTNGQPLPGPSFTCNECGYECVNASILKNHQLVKHSGEKPYSCPHCAYASSRKGRLGQHIREVHLALRPYMCETCGYRAPSTVKLEQHRQVHTEARPYTCDVCGQTYKDQGSFKRHVRRHISDERPHVCQICSRAFNRRSNLKVHLKNVHKCDLLPELSINSQPIQTLSQPASETA